MNKHLLLTGCLALGFLFCRCEDGSLVDGSSPSMNEVMPTRASAFFNSIGVNTHIGFYDTNYADFQGMLYWNWASNIFVMVISGVETQVILR